VDLEPAAPWCRADFSGRPRTPHPDSKKFKFEKNEKISSKLIQLNSKLAAKECKTTINAPAGRNT